jgi:hypothetical protein
LTPKKVKKESGHKASKTKKVSQTPITDEEINFNSKDHCVEEFSKRWWYALPEWPPQDYDFQ